MTHSSLVGLPIVLLLMVAALGGCSGPNIGPIAGTVRFEDGSPVQSGSIEFRSLENGRRYASRIDPNGRFEPMDASNRAGLPPGEYEVVVVQIVLTEDLAAEDHTHGTTVPRRYADYYTSNLRSWVQADQSTVEIELESE